MDSTVIAVLAGLLGLAVFWFFTRSGAVRTAVGLERPRTLHLMVGLVNSGKTTLIARLIGQQGPLECVSSMVPNRATLPSGQVVVDYPGHRRLRREVFSVLEEAKKVVVVVDTESIQDDRDEGAQALSELVCDLFQSKAFKGVTAVLFACTKRDSVTSFRAVAVKKLLENEMTHQLSTRSGTVGSIGAIQNVKTKTTRESNAARADDACMLFLNEDGKFSFGDLSVPVTFVEVSGVDNSDGLSADAVAQFLAE